jgi:hypothetical protein
MQEIVHAAIWPEAWLFQSETEEFPEAVVMSSHLDLIMMIRTRESTKAVRETRMLKATRASLACPERSGKPRILPASWIV